MSRLEAGQFLRVDLEAFGVACSIAMVDLDIAAFRPTELLKFLPEYPNPGLSFRIAFGIYHQHADSPDALGLLRVCSERPRDRRVAEERDELPSP